MEAVRGCQETNRLTARFMTALQRCDTAGGGFAVPSFRSRSARPLTVKNDFDVLCEPLRRYEVGDVLASAFRPGVTGPGAGGFVSIISHRDRKTFPPETDFASPASHFEETFNPVVCVDTS